MEPTESQTESPRRKRRWLQYSLRTLLIIMVLASIGMKFVFQMRQARRQREAVEAINRLGGGVLYDWQVQLDNPLPVAVPPEPTLGAEPSGPPWLRNLLGQDFFASTVTVSFVNSPVTDADLQHLEGLTQLRGVSLYGTQVTNAGLEHLAGLKQLQVLGLNHIPISDAGLEHLKGLTQLHGLNLRNNKDITGLEHLKGLTNLQELLLDNTRVTDAGLEHLKGLTQLQWLDLERTQVTDAGLEHLTGLKQLQVLNLDYTYVTEEGIKKLQQALPNCKIKAEHRYVR